MMVESKIAKNGRISPISKQDRCEELFARTITKSNGCMIWQGAINDNGFGYTKIAGKKVLVHRYIALYNVERTEPQLLALKHLRVQQKCGLTICINPLHLEFKTNKPEKVYEPMFDWQLLWDPTTIKLGLQV